MLPNQLDLFDNATTTPSTGLTGLQLRLSSPCHCGSDIVVVGSSKGPHSAAIACGQCHKHRGWISRAEFDRIAAIIGESGRSNAPINIGGAR
jgi:hypothetical protein